MGNCSKQQINPDFLEDMSAIAKRVHRHYENAAVQKWFDNPNTRLAGRTPIELILDGKTKDLEPLLADMEQVGNYIGRPAAIRTWIWQLFFTRHR